MTQNHPDADSPPPNLVFHVSWTPPPHDSWKLNFGGWLDPLNNKGGAGSVLRDQNAKFQMASAIPIKDCRNPLMAELIALHQGLIKAIHHGVEYIEIDGDHLEALRLVMGHTAPYSEEVAELLDDCFDLLGQFRWYRIRQVLQRDNETANRVALIATQLPMSRLWQQDPPQELAAVLVNDVIGRWIISDAHP